MSQSNIDVEYYDIVGGARVGGLNITSPFAKLRLHHGYLQLEYNALLTKGNLIFYKCNISSLEIYNGFISSGIKINHSIEEYDDKIIFWISNPEKYVELLLKYELISKKEDFILLKKVKEDKKIWHFPFKKIFFISWIGFSICISFSNDCFFQLLKLNPFTVWQGLLISLSLLITVVVSSLFSDKIKNLVFRKAIRTIDIFLVFSIVCFFLLFVFFAFLKSTYY